jgi:hypothetical protein
MRKGEMERNTCSPAKKWTLLRLCRCIKIEKREMLEIYAQVCVTNFAGNCAQL